MLCRFASPGWRENEVVATRAEFFQNPKFRAGDYPAGLSYAIEKGWLAKDADWIILTETGYRDLPKERW
jgi:hypothetical protein